MDGNGRWAIAHNLPRSAGHAAGVETVRRIAEAASGAGARTLTLFAFSSDNWKRPAAEVDALMQLFCLYLDAETETALREHTRLQIIGRRDRLSPAIRRAIEAAESATAHCARLHLRLAIDYSGRDAICEAARKSPALSRESIEAMLGPSVDLLIRTGGEHRLSDFLLWESAYAELVFSRKMWPDFTPADLHAAVHEFHCRHRRFGTVPPAAQPLVPTRELWLD